MSSKLSVRSLSSVLLVWAAWTALAIFFAVTTSLTYVSQGRSPLWGPVLAQTLAQWWMWAALTPLVFWLCRTRPLRGGSWPVNALIHVVVSLVVAIVKVTAEGFVREWLFGVRAYLLISNLALQVSIYWALVAATHVFQWYLETRQRAGLAESRLKDVELQLLRAQLQPHFLFNALGSIAELVHEDPDRADRMVGQLSDLLRATVDVGDRQEIALAEELALLDSYVAIQKTRYGDRLAFTLDIADECLRARVPYLVLQPLVENAIVHGVAARAGAGSVVVTARCGDRRLDLTVADDGAGWNGGVRERVGLLNTRRRLETLFGDAAQLTMTPGSTGGAVVRISLPLTAPPVASVLDASR